MIQNLNMNIHPKLEKLGSEKNTPCVTISLNTHRTHPDNAKDSVLLKKLLEEAETRVIAEFGKRPVSNLLSHLGAVEKMIDPNYNLDSLHLFLSNDTMEVIKSAWPVNANSVQISESFAIRPLIEIYNRNEEYLILALSQGGTQLYEALNDQITKEINNDDFPISQNKHYNTFPDKGSDPKHLDNLVREYLNGVDKAVVRVFNQTGLHCIVICTDDNYSRLMQVADRPGIYHGYAKINYNDTATHHLAKQGWELISKLQQERRSDAIHEMNEAIAHDTVLTDLQEIYQAALDGRGELLIVHQDFILPVVMTSDRTFDRATDPTQPGVIADMTSNIAWLVLSQKGRVIFTAQDAIKELGPIVLKTRY